MMRNLTRMALPALLLLAHAVFAAEPAVQQPAPPKASNTDPAAPTNAPTTQGSQPSAQATPARRPGNDRLDLDTTIVTGNRELPKVLYIVPWKKADLGELPAQPFNTLLDEVLTPVDRDVFRREVTYYGVVSSGADAQGGAAAPSSEPTGSPPRGDEK
jgi:hypothetical protein